MNYITINTCDSQRYNFHDSLFESCIAMQKMEHFCDTRYCINMSKTFPYEDERVIPAFIEDVQKFSVKFKSQEYIEVSR